MKFQPIENAPTDGTTIIGLWSVTSIDDDGQPTGDIVREIVSLTSYNGGWEEPAEIEAMWADESEMVSDAPTHYAEYTSPNTGGELSR